MSLTKYSRDHQAVKGMIERIQEETHGSSCVPLSELAKELDMDSRTVKKHLEIMEIDGFGKFSSTERKHIFCVNEKEE